MNSLTFKDQILLSSGVFGCIALLRTVALWLLYFLSPPDGEQFLSVADVGFAIMISQFVDGLVDPFIGYYGEKVRTRFGRRIPLMAGSIIPFLISFWLLFHPPMGLSPFMRMFYLLLTLSLFKISLSFYSVPHSSLIPEVTKTLKERTSLSSLFALFTLLGAALAMVFSGIIKDSLGQEGMIVIVGVIALVALLIPVLFFKETKYCEQQPKIKGMLSQWKDVLNNKRFLIVLLAILVPGCGYNIISMATPYIVDVVLNKPSIWSSYLLGSCFITTVLMIPLTTYIINKLGHEKSVTAMLVGFVVIYFSFFILKFLPQETSITFSFILYSLIGFPLAISLTIANVMMSDCIDEDVSKSGIRRESLFYGLHGLGLKLLVGVSTLMMTQIFELLGYSKGKMTGIYSAGPIAGLFCLIGLVFFLRVPPKEHVLD